MLENERISYQGILEGPFQATQARCQGAEGLLVVQDSTSIAVKHKDLYDHVKGGGGVVRVNDFRHPRWLN